MVKWLVLSSVMIVTSCAQVGRLNGGEKDETAPKTNEKSFVPENRTTNFTGNEVEINFDEFIRLNKPSESIKMIPGDAKVFAEISGRKLNLSWKDTLQPNTTYAIYLNKTVQDITEGNDSLMQYVFSTGNKIDSLQIQFGVKDAWRNTAEKGCIAVLKRKGSGEMVSFAESNEQGQITLNYLKPDVYEVLVFDDVNQDYEIDDHEKVGFPVWSELNLTSSFHDTVPIRMFHQIGKEKVSGVDYHHPGKIAVGFNYEPESIDLYFNNSKIERSNMVHLTKDSLFAFVPRTNKNLNFLIVTTPEFTDTFDVRMPLENAVLKVNPSNVSKKYLPTENVAFTTEDLIRSIDPSKMTVIKNDDSLVVSGSWVFDKNRLEFNTDEHLTPGIYRIGFEKKAITSLNTHNEEMNFLITKSDSADFGKLDLTIVGYDEPIIVYAMNGKKVERILEVNKPNEVLILNHLNPGQYHFKIVLDKNGNGKWDEGEMESRKQPEMVHEYSKIVKVRANWDVKATIERIYE